MVLNTISVGVGRRNRSFLCMSSRNHIFDIIIIIIIIIIINIVFVVVVMLQNHKVIVTSFRGCPCSGDIPRVLTVRVPAISGGRWVQGGWRMIVVLLWKMYVRMACKIKVEGWC